MPLGGQVPCRRHSDLQAGTSMAWYSCSEEVLRKRRLCQKLSGKLRTLATALQRRTPATETPDSIASFPSASFAGMVPFSLPSDSLPCLPGLVITESPRLCLLARPLDSTVVQTMSRKEAGHWQAGGFFLLSGAAPASAKVIPIPQKAIPAFTTDGKSHVFYRPKLEHRILSHMQIILSPGIRNTSEHVSVNTF